MRISLFSPDDKLDLLYEGVNSVEIYKLSDEITAIHAFRGHDLQTIYTNKTEFRTEVR